MSMSQLIPYARVADYFAQQMDFPISAGTLVNFNQSAYEALEEFETMAKQQLIRATIAHADETGINVDGKRRWLHCISNDLWIVLFPHEKRGSEANSASLKKMQVSAKLPNEWIKVQYNLASNSCSG